jgi:Cys-tRNA(Pro) deacylase
MASKDKSPVTAAVRQLRTAGISFTDHPYEYEEKGGTAVSARELDVDEYAVIKTLVMQDEHKTPLIVLMHGNMQVSAKELARVLGVKTIAPCDPDTANRHTGYLVGGTSPFGTRKTLPIYLERTILDLPRIYINGGKRGYLVGMMPGDLVQVLHPTLVSVATQK